MVLGSLNVWSLWSRKWDGAYMHACKVWWDYSYIYNNYIPALHFLPIHVLVLPPPIPQYPSAIIHSSCHPSLGLSSPSLLAHRLWTSPGDTALDQHLRFSRWAQISIAQTSQSDWSYHSEQSSRSQMLRGLDWAAWRESKLCSLSSSHPTIIRCPSLPPSLS